MTRLGQAPTHHLADPALSARLLGLGVDSLLAGRGALHPDGGVVAVEVKLAASVSDSDGKHLRWLRDQLGSRFVDGLILTTGPTAYRRQDGLAVVPLSLLGP